MNCITKYDMKFGDIVIPARTNGMIINKLSTDTVMASGIFISVYFNNDSIKKDYISNEIEIIEHHVNYNSAKLSGIVVDTNLAAVCVYADQKRYRNAGLYIWELEEIFGKDNVPESLIIGKHKYNGKDARLFDVIDYLERDFSKWIQENCEFRTLTKADIENNNVFYGADPGDTFLTDEGAKLYCKKVLEYRKKLEKIGFTYEFLGALNLNR